MVKALDYQPRSPVFKTTGWHQGQLSLSSFRGRSNEYQKLLGTWVKRKLPPRSGSAALRQLNLTHKKGPESFLKVFNTFCPQNVIQTLKVFQQMLQDF